MARRRSAIIGLALGLNLAADLLMLPAAAAQRVSPLPVVAPIVAGVVVPVPPIVVLVPGSGAHGGRADVDVDRERSRTRGRVVVR
jgi:hypothetical protein